MAEELGLDAVSYYLPEQRRSIVDWGTLNRKPDALVRGLLDNGHLYYYSADGLSATELARRALTRLVSENDIDRNSIDLLIYVHTINTSIPLPPQSLPMTLKTEFNMNNAVCFSVAQLNCASMIGALRIIRSLMETHAQWRSAIIVATDLAYEEAERNLRTNGMMSDGASALLVRKNPLKNRIGSIVIENYGQFHLGFTMSDESALKFNQLAQIVTYKAIKRAIDMSGSPFESFSHLVPNNLNRTAWARVPKLFGRDVGFLFDQNIAEKGHACCSDTAINLVDGGFVDLPSDRSVVVFARGNTGAFGAFTLHGMSPIQSFGRDDSSAAIQPA